MLIPCFAVSWRRLQVREQRWDQVLMATDADYCEVATVLTHIRYTQLPLYTGASSSAVREDSVREEEDMRNPSLRGTKRVEQIQDVGRRRRNNLGLRDTKTVEQIQDVRSTRARRNLGLRDTKMVDQIQDVRRTRTRRGTRKRGKRKRLMRELQNEVIEVSSGSGEVAAVAEKRVCEVAPEAKKARVYKPSPEEKQRWLRADDRLKSARIKERIRALLRAEARERTLPTQS